MKKTKKMLIMLMAFAAPIIFTNKAVAQAPVSSPTNTTYGGATEDGGCSSNTTGLLTSCPSGSNNTGFGTYVFNAGCTSSCSSTSPSGTDNTAVGYEAMFNNAINNNHNTAVGSVSQYNLSSGSGNSSLGYGALYTNTTGLQNTAIGTSALYYTTGSSNVGVGYYALYQNGAGGANVGVGYLALENPSVTNNNTAVGYYALEGVTGTSGNNNVGMGFQVLRAFTTAQSNTAIGSTALTANTTGNYNVAVGNAAMNVATAGNNSNVSVGSYSGGNVTNTSDVGDIYLGAYSDKTGTSNVNDAIAIGYSVTVTSNEQAELGDNNATTTLGMSTFAPTALPNASDVARLELNVEHGSTPFNITAADPEPAWVNPGGGGYGWSGLRFDDLTSSCLPGSNPGNGVLSLDGNGNVIYVNAPSSLSGNYWSLIGNTVNTTPGANFLGTLNSAPLSFQTNSTESGWIDYQAFNGTNAFGNTAFGYMADGNSVNSNLCGGCSGACTAIGYDADIDGGANTTAIGYQAIGNGGGGNCTGVGAEALFNNTSNDNTAVGANALKANISGQENTAIGSGALKANTGSCMTAVGYQALVRLSATVQHNVAVGNSALFSDQGYVGTGTGGDYNIAVGDNALNATNPVVGGDAQSNVAVGYQSGVNNSTGSGNAFFGLGSGTQNITGSYNTCLGYGANTGGSSNTNVTALGTGTGAYNLSNVVYLGNTSVQYVYMEPTTILSYSSDRRVKDNIKANVPGLTFINKIHPVTYYLDVHKQNEMIGIKNTSKDKYEIEKQLQSGFIAQEIDSAAQACGYDFDGLRRPSKPNEIYSVGYTAFVVPLVKSVQELSAQNTQLKTSMDSLKNVVQSMQACLNQICSSVGSNNSGNGTPANVQEVTISGSANSPILYQNTPNPFSTGTKINYFLPEGTMGATIAFYDSYGNQLKEVQLTQTGNGTINVNPDNMASGVYSYSLVVNSKVIDTKRMVLQK